MTTANYIIQISNGYLTLVDDDAAKTDEPLLLTDEYFALVFCTEYMSYLRNYIQYKGRSNYNEAHEVYDIEINKTHESVKRNAVIGIDGYYISKYYNKIKDPRGRVIIVSVSDLTKCNLLD